MKIELKVKKDYLQFKVNVHDKAWNQYFEKIENDASEPKMLLDAFDKLKSEALPKLHLIANRKYTTYFENNAHIVQISKKSVLFIVKFKIFPSVSLSMIERLKIDFKPLKFNASEIELELKEILLNATPLVDDNFYGVQKSDYVTINLNGFLKNQPIPGWKYHNLRLWIGHNVLDKAIDKAIINMPINTKKTVAIKFPSDHPNPLLRSQTATFKIEVISIIDKNKMPLLDDKLVKSLAINNVNNKKELTQYIAFVLREKTNQININKFSNLFFARVLAQIDFDIPHQLIDNTAQQIELKKHLDSLETLFSLENEKPQNYDFLAIEKIKKDIVLRDIARQQKIKVTEDEIDKTYKMIALIQNRASKTVKQHFSTLEIKKFALNQKVIKLLIKKTRK